jgi:hypothetical protein
LNEPQTSSSPSDADTWASIYGPHAATPPRRRLAEELAAQQYRSEGSWPPSAADVAATRQLARIERRPLQVRQYLVNACLAVTLAILLTLLVITVDVATLVVR